MALHLLRVLHPALAHRKKTARIFTAKQRVDVFVQVRAEAILTFGKILGDLVDDVDSESIHTEIDPVVDDILHLLNHSGIVPVQIRLADRVGVQVILAPLRVIFPRAAAEGCLPVIGRRVEPIVVVAVGIVPALARLLKPAVRGRGMVRHKIQDQLHVPRVQTGNKRAHIVQGAKLVHDVPIVRDVIAVIIVGALVAGTQPDGVDAEFLQIIQLFNDARQIADAVSVGVHEAAGIDLINHPTQKISVLCAKHIENLL